MTPCALPEVSELLERFQEKKATVKTRLNDIIDDLFGDFLTGVARMSSNSNGGKCSKCRCQLVSSEVQSVTSCGDTPSSLHGGAEEEDVSANTPQNLKVETTLRSAQARARELIKDELYDSDPVSRLSQSSGISSLKPSSTSSRSLPDNSADDETPDETPEITVTPIESVSSSAAALAAMVSASMLNGGGGGSSSRSCSSNGDHHPLQSTSTTTTDNAHLNNNNNGHSKDDFDSEEELEAEVENCNSAAANNNNKSNNNSFQPPSHDESQEEKSDDEAEEEVADAKTKSPENSNDANNESLFTEKSLDELNSLCAGLPYAKEGGRYICKFQDCCQELKSRHNLLLHQRAHLGIRPYRCKWSGCSYNSNQSSAVIRHIRTKHFLLPLTMREQQIKKIEDDRDPKEFLEVVTLSDGAITTTTTTSTSAAVPDSVEPPPANSSAESLQCVMDNETPTTNNSNNNGNYPKVLRSCRQSSASSTPTSATNGNRSRRVSVLQQNSSQQQQQPSPMQQSQQSLLMPQQPFQQQQQQTTNGRFSQSHRLPAFPPPPPASRTSHDESDEDEYDSEENDLEMIPMHQQQLAFEMMQQQMQVAAQQQQQQQLQQQLQQHQQAAAAAVLGSKSPFDYARKRRLESKIFANAALSNRNRLSSSNSNNNGGGVDYYGGGGGGSGGKVGKRTKYMGSYYGQHSPTNLEPLAAHSSSSSSSSQRGGGGGGGSGQHQYSFCPEEGCPSIFRTTIELDRHLTDVHFRLPQPKNLSSHHQGGGGSGPPKEPQMYTNLYICKWPKCPFSTVLHSSAINHVRGKHFNIPRTMNAQQRKLYANDTRNPNDYIKLLPFKPTK